MNFVDNNNLDINEAGLKDFKWLWIIIGVFLTMIFLWIMIKRKKLLMIKGANKHFIQQFKTAPTMIDLSMAKLESLDKDKLEEYKAIMSDYVQNVSIRSV